MISARAGSPSGSNDTRQAEATLTLNRLILASASPRRLALLAQIGVVPDQIAPQNLDESPAPGELPRPHAERLALAKARAAATPGSFALAADTVVAVGRRILPKAETEAQAARCLKMLSGRRHHVLTALVLITPEGAESARLSESTVSFARLTDQQIRAYLDGGEWHGKAGGYAIQGAAAAFIRALSGSYSGVVGLPLFETAQLLRGRGFLHP
jgi:septum formation protein